MGDFSMICNTSEGENAKNIPDCQNTQSTGYTDNDTGESFVQRDQRRDCVNSLSDVKGDHVTSYRAPSPLNTSRLKPIRQKIRNTMMTITDDCSVYLEILRTKQNLEIVREVMEISPDGHVIQVYQPKYDNTAVSDSPASPAASFVREYSHDRLPGKYWKKYQHAAKFVELVKSRTPKVTMYTDQAKCMLMENDNCDFEAAFYDGVKVRCSHNVTSITLGDGNSFTLESVYSYQQMTPRNRKLYRYSMQCRERCLKFVQVLTSSGKNETIRPGGQCFPVVIGRRPGCDHISHSKGKLTPIKEESSSLAASPRNNNNETAMHYQTSNDTLAQLPSPRSSTPVDCPSLPSFLRERTARETDDRTVQSEVAPKTSSASPTNAASVSFTPNQGTPPVSPTSASPRFNERRAAVPTILCKIFVSGIGWGTKWSNREVVIQFNDGSELSVLPDPEVIKYKCPQGFCTSFTEEDKIPSEVKEKLNALPEVVDKLDASLKS